LINGIITLERRKLLLVNMLQLVDYFFGEVNGGCEMIGAFSGGDGVLSWMLADSTPEKCASQKSTDFDSQL